MKNKETGVLGTKLRVTQVCSGLQNVFDSNIIYKVSCDIPLATDTSKSPFYLFLPNSVFSEVVGSLKSAMVGGYFHSRKLANTIKQTSPPLPQSWLLDICQHTTDRDQALKSNKSRFVAKSKL